MSLWDSYNVALAPPSKTYDEAGTSSAENATAALEPQSFRRHAARSFSMFDFLMLALGLGFFMLSIGYAYACERL